MREKIAAVNFSKLDNKDFNLCHSTLYPHQQV